MEECQARWTTYENQSIGLLNGKANYDDHGSFIIVLDKQLKCIINFDETALSLDGPEGQCGGRPAGEFYDPNLPAAYKRTSKSSVTIVMITGSSAAGDPLDPNFQFPTKSKNKNVRCWRK